MSGAPRQCTVKNVIRLSGVGLHTGHDIKLSIEPAAVDHGIVFLREDIPGAEAIPAHWSAVSRADALNTTLGKPHCSISTVEHLLSALHAIGIDNALVRTTGPEVPILDGSAMPFCHALLETGKDAQDAPRKIGRLEHPVYLSQGDITLVALPAEELRLSYTLHYPNQPLLHAQFHTQLIEESSYLAQCATCRTFTLASEVEFLRARGLIRGGSLDNAVVVDGDRILNPEGLRHPQEMARHKVLDLLGDLSLVGGYFQCHVIAIRSGHATNVAFARELASALMWS
jgi:UDP-3-O-[3-hydroxymyristoyl] N-acetylglucosamine deacetylase